MTTLNNYSETFAITVSGDSYYEKKIKRDSYYIFNYDMHDVRGLFGFVYGDNVGTEEEIDDRMEELNNEINDDFCDSDYERGDVQVEDNLVFYQKTSVKDLLEDHCNNDNSEKVMMLHALGIIDDEKYDDYTEIDEEDEAGFQNFYNSLNL